MLQIDPLESAIYRELARVGTCTFQELTERLPYYSWSQVFGVVDRLSQEGTITIENPAPSRFILSLALG